MCIFRMLFLYPQSTKDESILIEIIAVCLQICTESRLTLRGPCNLSLRPAGSEHLPLLSLYFGLDRQLTTKSRLLWLLSTTHAPTRRILDDWFLQKLSLLLAPQPSAGFETHCKACKHLVFLFISTSSYVSLSTPYFSYPQQAFAIKI
jgi:hypothetical protein